MKKTKYTICSILIAVFLFFSMSETLAISDVTSDGLYTATATDGVQLKMRRYRPTPQAPYREGAQPILLFPGIICNMNEFLSHTPEERANDYADMTLPEPIAEWTIGDPYILEDPMRYYSIAHYLWIKGYDPWFANYRGTGRGEFKSEIGTLDTTLDMWAILDVPPCIEKVAEITGQYPIIGGHSTGGLVSYAYLQGTYFEAGANPHVRSDPTLARERNEKIKGFIALDPAGIPPFPDYINSPLAYAALGNPAYVDIDSAVGNVVNPVAMDSDMIILFVDLLFGSIFTLDELSGEYSQFWYYAFWNPDNMHPYAKDFMARYGISSTFLMAISQYYDIGMHHAIREHWKNGEGNEFVIAGPSPDPENDGYYYYDVNMINVSVPTIAFLSESDSLVDADEIVEDLMEAKTHNQYDQWYVVPNSAHVDIPLGLHAPTMMFPLIGEWLEDITAATKSATEKTEDEEDKLGICFISTCMGG